VGFEEALVAFGAGGEGGLVALGHAIWGGGDLRGRLGHNLKLGGNGLEVDLGTEGSVASD